jgi:hypothetical protein
VKLPKLAIGTKGTVASVKIAVSDINRAKNNQVMLLAREDNKTTPKGNCYWHMWVLFAKN